MSQIRSFVTYLDDHNTVEADYRAGQAIACANHVNKCPNTLKFGDSVVQLRHKKTDHVAEQFCSMDCRQSWEALRFAGYEAAESQKEFR